MFLEGCICLAKREVKSIQFFVIGSSLLLPEELNPDKL